MRRYSEAVKADVRRRMSPPMRQSVAQISAELGIHVVTLYNWRKAWRLLKSWSDWRQSNEDNHYSAA
jgi:transposase-like protein